jgi:hypothetical protein
MIWAPFYFVRNITSPEDNSPFRSSVLRSCVSQKVYHTPAGKCKDSSSQTQSTDKSRDKSYFWTSLRNHCIKARLFNFHAKTPRRKEIKKLCGFATLREVNFGQT